MNQRALNLIWFGLVVGGSSALFRWKRACLTSWLVRTVSGVHLSCHDWKVDNVWRKCRRRKRWRANEHDSTIWPGVSERIPSSEIPLMAVEARGLLLNDQQGRRCIHIPRLKVLVAMSTGHDSRPMRFAVYIYLDLAPEIDVVFDNYACSRSNWTNIIPPASARARAWGMIFEDSHHPDRTEGASWSRPGPSKTIVEIAGFSITSGTRLSVRNAALDNEKMIEDVELGGLDLRSSEWVKYRRSVISYIDHLVSREFETKVVKISHKSRQVAREFVRKVLLKETRDARESGARVARKLLSALDEADRIASSSNSFAGPLKFRVQDTSDVIRRVFIRANEILQQDSSSDTHNEVESSNHEPVMDEEKESVVSSLPR
mmetsp:Transcript_6406/g.12797  ORF Transcript_6406/g.12797 Transcript_6406/m.12797 type:complete len:374 (-) Transcript_6406:341-1462(-)|eukprot:CAMPEP_0184690050 /NCGR_PEP_ID=MMETSP0312-20130426/30998_1 /TAXON_ID=31354 /ORGANISM="Compsopogon coeruleus, Strain SAG 36.94" /LENGTH=373 /DNA_ID=CAMNT_0027147477 /DNA_START=34 /DNA_END=1155 /DNA_ORIENTATION=+